MAEYGLLRVTVIGHFLRNSPHRFTAAQIALAAVGDVAPVDARLVERIAAVLEIPLMPPA